MRGEGGVLLSWRARPPRPPGGGRRRCPVVGAVAPGRGADALQRRGVAVGRKRPGGPAAIPGAVHLLAAGIEKHQVALVVAQAALVLSGGVEAVVLLELPPVLAQH